MLFGGDTHLHSSCIVVVRQKNALNQKKKNTKEYMHLVDVNSCQIEHKIRSTDEEVGDDVHKVVAKLQPFKIPSHDAAEASSEENADC